MERSASIVSTGGTAMPRDGSANVRRSTSTSFRTRLFLAHNILLTINAGGG
jgi:hypothetical protein